MNSIRFVGAGFFLAAIHSACLIEASHVAAAELSAEQDANTGVISVRRVGASKPLVTQNAPLAHRPYLHPIMAPDGRGVLTEFSPGHHKHQTGLYWGFTRLNGRDYFHHPGGDYWKRVDSSVLTARGEKVRWQTVYDLLDAEGNPVLRETQTWAMQDLGDEYLLELVWNGAAQTDVTIGKYDYGGLFLRMPWRQGIRGQVVNGARQTGARAEGQRAPWIDVGMEIEGRDDMAHIAIFDHGENAGYPQHWRVDGQLGVGPVRARTGDWTISQGDSETIRHGIRVFTGDLNDKSLTQKWSDYSGVGGTWALWNIARQEGREATFLSADQAVAAMTLPPGYRVNAFAHEPMITQPMAFCWDDRGRMWIAENRDYENRREGFANFGDSRILILEDTDRDGVADTRKVFCEGIPFPSAMAVGFDGLWLGAVPNLLFVPDRDGDDKADEDEIEVRLTGWGIRDRHETLNSFHWGPDGWLYGCQGYATPSRVGKPSGKGKLYHHGDPFPENIDFEGDPQLIDGGVWRYHPTKDRFEVVAHGFSNPWGIDYDAKGQLLISACVIPHLWHVIPGGIYHRQGGKHINPYYYSDIRTIADHRHRSAHGGARVYLSDGLPEKYHGRVFMANIHEHAVLTDILEPKGSGFVGRHGDDFLLANNAQWIGFSIEIGPEGAVYVLDWHDADICGNEVVNKDTGRVYRITSTQVQPDDWPGRYHDLSQMSDEELAGLQTSRSSWHARRARIILQHRSGSSQIEPAAIAKLDELFRAGSNADHRLRALWTLHVIDQLPIVGSTDRPSIIAALEDADDDIRAWAVQLAGEDGYQGAEGMKVLNRLTIMARSDTSPRVRLYLASALQRIKPQSKADTPILDLASRLAQHAEDADDHNIPKMLWFGIEPHVVTHPARALRLARESRIPVLTKFIARRLADADLLETVVSQIGEETNRDVQSAYLEGLSESLRGRVDLAVPPSWDAVYAKLRQQGVAIPVLTEIAQQFGNQFAVDAALATLRDESADIEVRKRALRGLATQQRPQLKQALPDLLDDPTLRRDAIRAIASYDDKGLTELLLSRYERFNADEKMDTVQTLASRRQSANALTKRIADGTIPKRDIPAYVARQMRRVVGNSFTDAWGAIDGLSRNATKALDQYRELLTKEAIAAANPNRGRVVFKRTCRACHTLYGDGGRVGPEITGANRGNLEYLLSNIVAPSAEIQDAYRMTLVLTDEGRTYSGIVAGEDDRQLLLRVANEEEPISVPKSTIESREIAPVSMMPEGLLETLDEMEILDLIAYLQTSTQVEAEE